MKQFLKVLALAVACVMTLSALFGCTETEKPSNATTVAAGTTGAPEATESNKSETTMAPATDAPGTTNTPETEPPVVLNTIYKWDFDSDTLGWAASSATKKLESASDGILVCECTAGDPNITTTKMPAKWDCETIEYIVIRLKNCTDSYSGQLFITTSDSPGPSESYSLKFDYEYCDSDNEEWENLEIDTFDIPGWTGELKSLRFDYSECSGSADEPQMFYIDYIEFATTKAYEQDTADVTTVNLLAGKQLKHSFTFTDGDEAKWDAAMAAQLELPEESEENLTKDAWTKCYFDSKDHTTSIDSWEVDKGILKMNIYGIDPFIVSPLLEDDKLYCEEISVIVLKVCNRTQIGAGQVFFSVLDEYGEHTEFGEAASYHIFYDNIGDDTEVWETIVIDTSECSDWTGQLCYLRYDMTNSEEGQFWIESIEFYG